MERGEVLRSVVVLVEPRWLDRASSPRRASSPSTARTARSTNNIWLVGDDREVLVIDAAHDHRADRRGGRRPPGARPSCCTHGHNDHINAAVALADAVDAPILLHPDDLMLWDVVYPDRAPDGRSPTATRLGRRRRARRAAHARAQPRRLLPPRRRRPTSCSRGDTLFNGGPGATGRSFSATRPTIVRSIRDRLLPLPADTVVHTGHGDDTTIGAEAAGVQAELSGDAGTGLTGLDLRRVGGGRGRSG